MNPNHKTGSGEEQGSCSPPCLPTTAVGVSLNEAGSATAIPNVTVVIGIAVPAVARWRRWHRAADRVGRSHQHRRGHDHGGCPWRANDRWRTGRRNGLADHRRGSPHRRAEGDTDCPARLRGAGERGAKADCNQTEKSFCFHTQVRRTGPAGLQAWGIDRIVGIIPNFDGGREL